MSNSRRRPGLTKQPDAGILNTPLLFVNKSSTNFNNSRQDAARIASHVVSKYRPFKKNVASLNLDNTTKAILASQTKQKIDEQLQAQTATQADTNLPGGDESNSNSPSTRQSSIFSVSISPAVKHSAPTSCITTINSVFVEEDLTSDFDQITSKLRLIAMSSEETSDTTVFAWRLFEEYAIPEVDSLKCRIMDPFSVFGYEMDREMRSNVHFYFTVIRPFATNLIDSWWWCDSLAQIQCSRSLSYAVAAFASLFLSGCLRGGPGVVLPPPVEPGQRSRWPNPPWLRLQTMCISELSAQLQNFDQVDDSCFAAILFLFRISVVLADGPSARMHARALRKLGSSLSNIKLNLNAELAVAKVNIISAFLHHRSTVVVRQRPNHRKNELSHAIEIDGRDWDQTSAWHSMRGALAARTLAWSAEEPATFLQQRTESEISRIDENADFLSKQDHLELQLCYQIALFLTHILHCITFNTAAPRVRSNVLLLKSKLSAMNLQQVGEICPNLLFNILLAGAIACHSHIERLWFVGNLSRHFPRIQYMDDVRAQMAVFIDPMTLVHEVVEEVWMEVLKLRYQTSGCEPLLWRGDSKWIKGERKALRNPPNLSRFRRVIVEAEMGCDVKPEFE